MIPMDTDKTLRQRFAPRTGDNHLYLLRDSTCESDGHTATEDRPINGVGSSQVVRPSHASAAGTPMHEMHDAMSDAVYGDGLSAARGVLFGSVLGIGFWSMVAGLIAIVAF